MYAIITDTMNMIGAGISATAPYAICAWLMITMYQQLFDRRRRPSLMLLAMIFYAALLLWGTCISRVDSMREFFTWRRTGFNDFFTNEFSLTSPLAVWHEFMNVVLFIPFGFFCAAYSRPTRGAAAFIVLGCLLSCLIEAFQGFHGLVFDIGDVLTNTLGTLVGFKSYRPALHCLLRMRALMRRQSRAPGPT